MQKDYYYIRKKNSYEGEIVVKNQTQVMFPRTTKHLKKFLFNMLH